MKAYSNKTNLWGDPKSYFTGSGIRSFKKAVRQATKKEIANHLSN